MRLLKAIFFLPVLVCILPALLIVSIMVLMGQVEERTLRSFLSDEMRKHGFGKGLRVFMLKIFVPQYRNTIQSFVLAGAGFLVVAVGLRSLMVLPVEVVYAALAIEYALLLMWAVTVYFTDDSEIQTAVPAAANANTDLFVQSMNQLSSQVDLLEKRLGLTQDDIRQFSQLDSSLHNLTAKLDMFVGDQINSRVRQEFEQIITEMSLRTRPEAEPFLLNVIPGNGNGTGHKAAASSW